LIARARCILSCFLSALPGGESFLKGQEKLNSISQNSFELKYNKDPNISCFYVAQRIRINTRQGDLSGIFYLAMSLGVRALFPSGKKVILREIFKEIGQNLS